MNRETALAIGRAVQQHPFGGVSLTDRIADELMKAFDAGAASSICAANKEEGLANKACGGWTGRYVPDHNTLALLDDEWRNPTTHPDPAHPAGGRNDE